MPKAAKTEKLPSFLGEIFWDYDFKLLSLEEDRNLVIGRVLAEGNLEAIRWLRAAIGNDALREWIMEREGRGLTPQQIRFWELILHLPHRQVNAWLRSEGRQIWDKRTNRHNST
jgi:hypothetical protein